MPDFLHHTSPGRHHHFVHQGHLLRPTILVPSNSPSLHMRRHVSPQLHLNSPAHQSPITPSSTLIHHLPPTPTAGSWLCLWSPRVNSGSTSSQKLRVKYRSIVHRRAVQKSQKTRRTLENALKWPMLVLFLTKTNLPLNNMHNLSQSNFINQQKLRNLTKPKRVYPTQSFG